MEEQKRPVQGRRPAPKGQDLKWPTLHTENRKKTTGQQTASGNPERRRASSQAAPGGSSRRPSSGTAQGTGSRRVSSGTASSAGSRRVSSGTASSAGSRRVSSAQTQSAGSRRVSSAQTQSAGSRRVSSAQAKNADSRRSAGSASRSVSPESRTSQNRRRNSGVFGQIIPGSALKHLGKDSQSSRNSSGARRRPPAQPVARVLFLLGPLLFLPLAFVYLELIFHIYMGLSLKYLPVYFFFALAAGVFLSLLASFFKQKVNFIITCVITGIFSLLFYIEILCKFILQQYFQLLSTAGTAANNKLTDYAGAILEGILKNLHGLVLMFLPLIFLLVFGRKLLSFRPKPLVFGGFTLVLTLVIHLVALLMVHLPWSGDFTPKTLYATDTNVDDQVEQLGVITMLRLDIKHSIFGASSPTISTDALDQLDQLNDAAATPEPTVTDTPVDTSPNVMELDFSKVENINDDVTWLNEYIQSASSSNKNKYTGMFEGYNVIFITAEGFSGYAISEELTPTLYKLTHEGFVFNNFYSALHYTSTSGGEFQNLTGLYPKAGNPISMTRTGELGTYLPFTLANELNGQNYTSVGYHFNGNMYGRDLSHPNLGYNWKQGDDVDMEKTQSGKNVWPQSDLHMVEATIDEYINQQPFNIYYMTISGHMPYTGGGNAMAVRNQDVVANLPYSQETKDYLAATYELEKGLTYLVQRLEEAGIADKTLLVMAPDHIPYFDIPVLEELAGQTFGKSEDFQYLKESSINFDVYRNSLIIWSASMEEPVNVDKVCCQVDILPTLLNLLGVEYDSRLMAGTDILSDSPGLVVFSSNSWMSDQGFYNRFTKEFTPAAGSTLTGVDQENYVSAMKTLVSCKIQMTPIIIENDYYRKLLG